MISNVIGRVKNTTLPKSQALLPLFEAIVNSIDAIESEVADSNNGEICIQIIREQKAMGFPIESPDSVDDHIRGLITGFEIIDNGAGFTDQNFDSFNTADSQQKEERGGKGVGRFLWLKAFEKVEVESVFLTDGQKAKRKFTFSLASRDGVSNSIVIDAPNEKQETHIRLLGLRNEFQKILPQSAEKISQRIVEHCLEYFYLARMPRIKVVDVDENIEIDLDSTYGSLVAEKAVKTIDIKGQKFDLTNFLLHARTDLKHHISYCANRRVVITEKIGDKIPNLPSALRHEDEGDELVYAGYVSSDYLDGIVNAERTAFNAINGEGFILPGEVTWNEIQTAIYKESAEALKIFTDKVKVQKEERIRKFVNDNAPEYRYILKNYSEKLAGISPDVSDIGLETLLHEIHQGIASALKREADEFIKQDSDNYSDNERDKVRIHLLESLNDVGKANLAKYIIHRKVMLTFLEKALKRRSTGKYALEEEIHNIIFPMKSTTDDITYEDHNLWIIDEKLAYHYYLSSDIPFKQVKAIESNSESRPDLLIFNKPLAVVGEEAPFSSIVIFEFKRPMRDDYSENGNPIQQVLHYVDEIKQGNCLDKDGRQINVPGSTPFYCYIVGDLTKTLKDQAKYAGLRLTPDACGYFGYNDEIGAYVEIIDLEKLIRDAKKRNKILFDKLGLPNN